MQSPLDTPLSRALGIFAATLLLIACMSLDQITIAANDYMAVIAAALGCALGSAYLFVRAWHGCKRAGRIFLLFAILANSAVVADCLRRLWEVASA